MSAFHYGAFLPLLSALFASCIATPTPTKASDCSPPLTWTVTSLVLADTETPNYLFQRPDKIRDVDFHVSGDTLPAGGRRCGVNSNIYNRFEDEPTRQFTDWTYGCWDPVAERMDPNLAFKFVSEAADEDQAHPATFSIKQGVACRDGEIVEAEATVNIGMSCGTQFYGCGPCFTHQCNATEFVITSD